MPVDASTFAAPPARFRGAPFWSLNHDLTDHDRLREQIDAFQAMGLGGYHLHVRAGLKTDYMGEEFLAAIMACREHGQAKGMLSYLYDEDTWPSGFAGGEVTRNLDYRRRSARLQRGRPQEDRYDAILAAYRIELDAEGRLLAAERLDPAHASDDDWFFFRRIDRDNDRFNGQAYIDVMNPAAVDAFIASTHERYLQHFGGSFPADVPAIFTDEPQVHGSHHPADADGDAHLPWTDDLPATFAAAHGGELLDLIPQVIWPGAEGPSRWRWCFWDHIAERFAAAFNDRIGQWCAAHGIALTGHLMAEASLASQMGSLGEAMRHYRAYQIPGIDILCDHYEPSTAKQAASVARQDGRSGVLSELYGVTNWDFPFRGHKCQGDWQAALGITLRVHHLAWVSMEGDSKRDYPAAIGPQSPWFREYPLVEDHFARVNAALATGSPLVRVGVVHPVESAWLHRGVASLEGIDFDDCERGFNDLIHGLLEGHIDFDFIAESLLPRQERATDAASLQVGAMVYDVVVLPQLTTIRSSTLASLEAFLARGGTVIALGGLPPRLDGAPSDEPAARLAAARIVSRSRAALLEALEPWREIEVRAPGGVRRPTINHQLRVDGDERVLFCCNRLREPGGVRHWSGGPTADAIRIRGRWRVRELDTMSGEERDCAFHQESEVTIVPWRAEPHGHRLLRLMPGEGACELPEEGWQVVGDLGEPDRVTREEANVLLLDRAAWRVDDEPWQPVQESIRTHRQLAERFGWPDWAQPYSVKDRGQVHRVARRFTVVCEVPVTAPKLVCERAAEARISLDGETIDSAPGGWWVDHDLKTVALPNLAAGEHVIEVELPLDAIERHLEWCYLLGDFGVETRGAHARIVAPREDVVWGDAVPQGLAFYGGNLDYRCTITVSEPGRYALRCPDFAGPVMRVSCDGADRGPLAFSPYRIDLGEMAAGEHEVVIRCFGNRANCFGALHNNDPHWNWWGPASWRTTDRGWNEAWQFWPAGITRAPILERQVK